MPSSVPSLITGSLQSEMLEPLFSQREWLFNTLKSSRKTLGLLLTVTVLMFLLPNSFFVNLEMILNSTSPGLSYLPTMMLCLLNSDLTNKWSNDSIVLTKLHMNLQMVLTTSTVPTMTRCCGSPTITSYDLINLAVTRFSMRLKT